MGSIACLGSKRMSWHHAFELMCFLIVGIMLAEIFFSRARNDLFLFLTAALICYICETAVVSLTDLYHYRPDFWLSIGFPPDAIPLFVGLIWGGLTVQCLRLAQKLHLKWAWTALMTGFFIVTTELFLDVVAMRLAGGFLVWEGREISLKIDQHAFMGVIWIRFFGCMAETFAVAYLTLEKRRRVNENDWKGQWKALGKITGCVLLITGVISLLGHWLNRVTNDCFSVTLFFLLWCLCLIHLVQDLLRDSPKPSLKALTFRKVSGMLFWSVIYLYSLLGILSLGIARVYPVYLLMGVAAYLVSLLLCLAGKD